ncbi:MAG: hypothetical protein Q4A42_03660 [Tissierellia bacterium]|nr:hypothetical protein [Tissierellia bacterium]
MTNKIKDFFYNFTDIIIALLLIAGIVFVLHYNLSEMMEIKGQADIQSESIEKTPIKEEFLEVYIPAEISKEQLSDILAASSLIKDKKIFLEEINKADKSLKIKSGTYKFKKDSTNQEIIDLLLK